MKTFYSFMHSNFQNDLVEISDWHEIAIRKQSGRFHALRPFSDLIGWLKLVRPGAYQTLVQVCFNIIRKFPFLF